MRESAHDASFSIRKAIQGDADSEYSECVSGVSSRGLAIGPKAARKVVHSRTALMDRVLPGITNGRASARHVACR